MRSVFLRLGVLMLVMLPAGPLLAYGVGTPIATDSRIKTFVYNENDVYRLLTHYGYQMNVEFGNKEEIETISVGDRTGWQIIPAGNRLFVRGMEDKAHTNMTVVTNRHAYQFDLYSAPPGSQGWDELVYVVRFYYPEDAAQQNAALFGSTGAAAPYPPMMAPPIQNMAAPVAYTDPGMGMGYSAPMQQSSMNPYAMQPQPAPMMSPQSYAGLAPSAPPPGSYNYNYSFTGEQTILPTQMYDDGQRTYLTFNAGQILPQLFMVLPDRREQAVGGSANGQTLMVQGVYPRLVLRFGNSHACIYNDGMGQ